MRMSFVRGLIEYFKAGGSIDALSGKGVKRRGDVYVGDPCTGNFKRNRRKELKARARKRQKK